MTLDVRSLEPQQRNTVVAVVARAFWDDPLYNVFMPDLGVQHRLAPVFFASNIDDCARHGKVDIAHVDGTIAGVAAWLPPGVAVPTSGPRVWAQHARTARVLVRAQNRRLALALQRELPKWQMRDDHWFLSILASDPRFQGRGVASALMDPVLADADNTGTPVFLRTQREANLAFYRRFGFDVTDTIALERSPTVWTMTRHPR